LSVDGGPWQLQPVGPKIAFVNSDNYGCSKSAIGYTALTFAVGDD
jgi:hypothetical protein